MWAGWTYTQPLYPALLILALGASWCSWRRASPRASKVAFAALLAIFLWSWPPFHWLFALPFERPYRSAPQAEGADVIVVFGGGVWHDYRGGGNAVATSATLRRCLHAAQLYRSHRDIPLVATGTVEETRIMAETLGLAGVPQSKILTEDRSRNTWESVQNTVRLASQHGWERIVVVTDAYHMPRVVATYRRFGISPIPAACGFFTLAPPWTRLLPNGSAVRHNELLLHELVGLAWYALRPVEPSSAGGGRH